MLLAEVRLPVGWECEPLALALDPLQSPPAVQEVASSPTVQRSIVPVLRGIIVLSAESVRVGTVNTGADTILTVTVVPVVLFNGFPIMVSV